MQLRIQSDAGAVDLYADAIYESDDIHISVPFGSVEHKLLHELYDGGGEARLSTDDRTWWASVAEYTLPVGEGEVHATLAYLRPANGV